MNIDTLDYHQHTDLYKNLRKTEMLMLEVDFGSNQEKLKPEYLDVYEGVYVKIISTNRFDKNSDLSTTYLGQVNMIRNTEIKAEERVPMTV